MNPLKSARSHVRRSAVELVNAVLNHDPVLSAIGTMNRRIGIIESVFLVYPANERYGLSYAYPRRLARNRWRPWPTGLLLQNGKVTVMVAVSSHDLHYWDEAHHESLVQLAQRMEQLRLMLGARQKSFAGILPGVLASRGILEDGPEGDVTARLVAQAIRDICGPQDLPIVILGSRGYIGRRLVTILAGEMDVHPVDTRDELDYWPHHLTGRPALLVNVANRGAIAANMHRLWPGLTILNEVYPEPERETLRTLSEMSIQCHHVVGVKAKAFPAFPSAYRGAIPCCAAWPSEEASIVTRALN